MAKNNIVAKKRILVLGCSGMLGQMVLKVLSKEKEWEVVGTQSKNLKDIDYFRVENGLNKLESLGWFDYIINCIAITDKHIEENSSSSIVRAIRVNALFPHELAHYSEEQGIRMIHISTDGVFSGKSSFAASSVQSYDEEKRPDCSDLYGKTKSLGEIVSSNAITIRTSFIGPSPIKKEGLFEWFLSQPQNATIQGFTNHTWHGVTTLQFADLCVKILTQNAFEALRQESSIFHFIPNQAVTKYQLLNIFKDTFRPDLLVQPVEDPHGSVQRVLATKYEGVKMLYGFNRSMEEEIKRLAEDK